MKPDDDLLIIGKVVGVHGIRGGLKVLSYAESPTFFDETDELIFRFPKGSDKVYAIEETNPRKGGVQMLLAGIEDRNAAEGMVGAEILVSRADLPEPGEEEYYWSDLIGLGVYTIDDAYLGRLTRIMPTGGNDVYVIRNREKETLIPAVKSVVVSIDIGARTMRVALPEGL